MAENYCQITGSAVQGPPRSLGIVSARPSQLLGSGSVPWVPRALACDVLPTLPLHNSV